MKANEIKEEMNLIDEINSHIDLETKNSEHCSQLILGSSAYEQLKDWLRVPEGQEVKNFRGLEVKMDYSTSSDFICVIPF